MVRKEVEKWHRLERNGEVTLVRKEVEKWYWSGRNGKVAQVRKLLGVQEGNCLLDVLCDTGC